MGLVGLARVINVYDAIVPMLGGLVAGRVSGTSAPSMDPQIVLLCSCRRRSTRPFGVSTQDLRAHARAIGLLVVGLLSRAKKPPARIQKV
jgi:hypothetical protein